MDRKWLGVLLGLSLLVNAALLTLLLSERRTGEPARALAAAELTASPSPQSSATTASRPTATRKPQPIVAQAATRAMATAAAVEPTQTALPPTDEPTEAPTAAPTATAAPEIAPSPTLIAAGTDWLQYLNVFRGEANLPPVLEDTAWSLDAMQHSRYMVYTGVLSHSEDPASPYFTRAGNSAAENGNIAAGFIGSDPFKWAFNYWMSAPFHALPMLDPQLGAVGFAEYRDANGVQDLTATLDVRRGLGALPGGVTFPIAFPREGGRTWVLQYSLPEFPEALSTCPGYQQPTGAPIILQLGDGGVTPNVTATALYRDGEYLAHCRFDETTFTHPNEFRQRSARTILDQRDAIVIIPQEVLKPDATYSVRVDVNGETHTWSFHTTNGP